MNGRDEYVVQQMAQTGFHKITNGAQIRDRERMKDASHDEREAPRGARARGPVPDAIENLGEMFWMEHAEALEQWAYQLKSRGRRNNLYSRGGPPHARTITRRTPGVAVIRDGVPSSDRRRAIGSKGTIHVRRKGVPVGINDAYPRPHSRPEVRKDIQGEEGRCDVHGKEVERHEGTGDRCIIWREIRRIFKVLNNTGDSGGIEYRIENRI
ncbi:hypothetical protein B0H13DRAFT_1929171 [Mycena leptocephala]|nr:hypothetical protein B0H13DRAFT_1929171 [Mycena leptocephala]